MAATPPVDPAVADNRYMSSEGEVSATMRSIKHDGLSFEWYGYSTIRIQTETQGEQARFDFLEYRELQTLAKERGIRANQTKEELRDALRLSEELVIYIDPGRFGLMDRFAPHDADYVFVTHNHHYDPDAVRNVSNDETVLYAYGDNDYNALRPDITPPEDLNMEVEFLEYDEEYTIRGRPETFQVRTLPAYNRSDGPHVDEDGNPLHAKGDVVGLHFTINDTTVYWPSDTDFVDELTDVRADVFFPPVGGTFTMDADEAIRFAESVNPKLLIPVHYSTLTKRSDDDPAPGGHEVFENIKVDPDEFLDRAAGHNFDVEII
jgi:L-ascorbate metabolism protein UlaG (beta-lactamase superfamily)